MGLLTNGLVMYRYYKVLLKFLQLNFCQWPDFVSVRFGGTVNMSTKIRRPEMTFPENEREATTNRTVAGRGSIEKIDKLKYQRTFFSLLLPSNKEINRMHFELYLTNESYSTFKVTNFRLNYTGFAFSGNNKRPKKNKSFCINRSFFLSALWKKTAFL